MSVIVRRTATAESDLLPFPPDLSPLLKRIYATRGLHGIDDLDLSMAGLLKPDSLKGLDDAVSLLLSALESSVRILIVGDFDADGATSCALSVKALSAMGFQDVRFLVPNRFDYGYGLTPEIVKIAAQQKPGLIITVDNGISSVEGVEVARKLGMKVLITDHHLPGAVLPKANAIVNPNQVGCAFPSKSLAGVGVIFYVMLSLRAALRDSGWFDDERPEPNLAEFLDLVALGTVADVVPLDKNNRILVEQGLRRIRAGKACPGIRALIEVSGRSAARLTAADIGFALGPRLNAAGRLDDISIGIACLLANDYSLSYEIAVELDGLNKDRQQIERGMQLEADKTLEELDRAGADGMPLGLSLYDARWHQGVVGILASRIKERYYRPVVCFANENDADDCDSLKGSGRSIAGFHIRDAFEAIATKNPALIDKFGGHAMAAGLVLKKKSLDTFSTMFAEEVAKYFGQKDLRAMVVSDGELVAEDISIENASLLQRVMPWGQQLPEPLFDGTFVVVSQRLVGERHLKLVVSQGEHQVFDAIAFNVDTALWPDTSVKEVQLAYRLDVNRYRGRESLQLMVNYLEKVN